MKEREKFYFRRGADRNVNQKATAYLGYAEVLPRLRVPAKRTDACFLKE